MSACHAMASLPMILGGPSLLLSLYISYLSISYHPSSSPTFFLSVTDSFSFSFSSFLFSFFFLLSYTSFSTLPHNHISHLILIINFLLSFYSSSSPSNLLLWPTLSPPLSPSLLYLSLFLSSLIFLYLFISLLFFQLPQKPL